MQTSIELRNRQLVARFCPQTGDLVHLSFPEGESLLAGTWRQHAEGQRRTSSQSGQTDAAPFRTVSVEQQNGSVISVIESDQVRVTERWTLTGDDPLLACEVTVEPATPEAAVKAYAFPHVEFAPDFNDVFEDPQDLYYDGEELDSGRELPCWRVFFRRGHGEGVIAATRAKRQMSHFQMRERGFEIRPDAMVAYDSNTSLPGRAMTFKDAAAHRARFEIGPWRRSEHEAILAAAKLDEPVETGNPLAEGAPSVAPAGILFDAWDIAGPDQASDAHDPLKWRRVRLPYCFNGRALYAGCDSQPPPLTLDPKLSGVYRILVGIGNGQGVTLRLSDDPLPTYRVPPGTTQEETPFHLLLSGRQPAREVELGVVRMDGKSLELRRYPNEFLRTIINYVRFEPLTEAEAAEWEVREKRPPCISLVGLNDMPDIAYIVCGTAEAYESNLRDHARAGMNKVYWRVDGQCSDFWSKINTKRYISAKTHSQFTPTARGYGRLLEEVDLLDLGVKAARKYGLSLYGWMRFNSYMGNVQSDFFKQNPQFHEEWENGYRAGKLCLAIEEVRRHKLDILLEAAAYGLDGLCVGILRHPPVLLYHPILVEGYTRKFGEPPPRDRARADATLRQSLPPSDDRHTRWYQYRAEFMTMFGRQLRRDLDARGMKHVKVSLWVRPHHCLFDGIDLKTWLDEGLCNEVVAEDYGPIDEKTPISAEWRRMVQAKALLIRGTSGFKFERARQLTQEAIDQGYDGVSTYESDQSVLDSNFIRLYHSLRR